MTSASRDTTKQPIPDPVTWQKIMLQLATVIPYHLPTRRW